MIQINFTTLQSEFFARGFNYLSDGGTGLARAQRWINQSYAELCELEDWPFCQATVTGTAPLTVTDLRSIESVIDTNQSIKLHPIDRRTVTDWYGDQIAVAGAAWAYWIDQGNIVTTYPATAALQVRYYKVPTDLSSGSDVPIVPARFQELIVLGAVRKGLLDDSAEGDYQAVNAEWTAGVQRMTSSLLDMGHDSGQMIVSTEWRS